MQSFAGKNGYYSLSNKKTKQILFVEYHEGDWYCSDKVKDTQSIERDYDILEFMFSKPRPVRDCEMNTVIKRDSEKKPEEKRRGRRPRKGRVKVDANPVSENSKYMHEFKTIFQ